MRKIALPLTLFAIMLVSLLHAMPAQAQNTRTFVSGHGSDSNPCTLASPCRSFQAAFNVTNPGGELDVLDTAGYGTLTISYGVSIINPVGVVASIAVPSGGTGITISAPASDTVILRGLTVEGAGVGLYGINFTFGGRLEIIDSVIRNFTNTGVIAEPSAANISLLISNSFVLDNTNAGIYLTARPTGQMSAIIDRVTASKNTYGIYIDSSATNEFITATITNSIISYNLNTGIAVVKSNSFSTSAAYVKDSILSDNAVNGVSASGPGGGFIFLSHSMILGNNTGINIGTGSSVFSAGNNDISNNPTPVSGTLTSAPEQ
jgi:hypothetical protein